MYYSSLLPTLKDVQVLSKNVFISVIFEYDDICGLVPLFFSMGIGKQRADLTVHPFKGIYILAFTNKNEKCSFFNRLIQCHSVVLYSLFLVIHHNS